MTCRSPRGSGASRFAPAATRRSIRRWWSSPALRCRWGVSRCGAAARDEAARVGGGPRGRRGSRAGRAGQHGELLAQARQFYERLEVERALPLLRQIVSPNWPFEVTADQRVDAYKYLGACLALAGKRDSAVLYFRAAIERDPFTELDASRFTPAQLATFDEARRRTLAVAVRPVQSARVDPRTARVTFTVVATHAALVDVKLSAVGAGTPLVLFQGTLDGVREIAWDGLLANRRLALPGRYTLAVVGRSRLTGAADSARVYFDLRHEVAPLEDTLPALDRGALRSEERRVG